MWTTLTLSTQKNTTSPLSTSTTRTKSASSPPSRSATSSASPVKSFAPTPSTPNSSPAPSPASTAKRKSPTSNNNLNSRNPQSAEIPSATTDPDFTSKSTNQSLSIFKKFRVQEIQSELPRGCIPRSVEIILRAEAVETAQPGDRCDFIGTLIVVPDVGALNLPGARSESNARHKGDESEGVRGLKSLGVRDLHYRLAFLACSVQSVNNSPPYW